MKIGIIGLGSIGRQHARQLKKLGVENICALRTKLGSKKELDPEFGHIQEFDSEREFFNQKSDGIIIANPTHLHVEYALKCVSSRIPVLIEKPIEHTTNGIKVLSPDEKLIRVAYCMRFHSIISRAKELMAARLGTLFKLSFTRGFYLPSWHPYADYRSEYAAQKQMGGGAIRTLSHEIDLINYFGVGPVMDVSGICDTLSNLELNTDDFAFFSCKLQNKARANFEIDFLNSVNTNRAVIIGSGGQLDYDLSQGTLEFTDRQNRENVSMKEDADEMFDRMYRDQAQDFLNFIQTGKSRNCTVKEAYDVLKIIDQVEVHEK